MRVFLLIKMMPFRQSHNLFAATKKWNTSQDVKLIQMMFLSHFNGNETQICFFIKYFITAMRKQNPEFVEKLRHHAHLIQDLPVVKKTPRISRYRRKKWKSK